MLRWGAKFAITDTQGCFTDQRPGNKHPGHAAAIFGHKNPNFHCYTLHPILSRQLILRIVLDWMADQAARAACNLRMNRESFLWDLAQ